MPDHNPQIPSDWPVVAAAGREPTAVLGELTTFVLLKDRRVQLRRRPEKVYEAEFDGTAVRAALIADGHSEPMPLHDLPRNFGSLEYGYLGSGPLQLARQILWNHHGAEPLEEHYQDFASEILANRSGHEKLVLADFQIEDWVQQWRQHERQTGNHGFVTKPERATFFGLDASDGERGL